MEKLKIYLDTNTIIDFFINEARTLKNDEKPKIPRKFQFMTEKSSEIGFVTSFITKAEIARELSSAFHLSENEIDKLWNQFTESIGCRYLKEFKFDDRIVSIPLKMKIRLRTLFNFMHLFIAMEENAYFLSGDNDIIEKIRTHKVYDKVLTYVELRKMF